jgi:hypothetical protein
VGVRFAPKGSRAVVWLSFRGWVKAGARNGLAPTSASPPHWTHEPPAETATAPIPTALSSRSIVKRAASIP